MIRCWLKLKTSEDLSGASQSTANVAQSCSWKIMLALGRRVQFLSMPASSQGYYSACVRLSHSSFIFYWSHRSKLIQHRKRPIFVFYCCITDYHKSSSFKSHKSVISQFYKSQSLTRLKTETYMHKEKTNSKITDINLNIIIKCKWSKYAS